MKLADLGPVEAVSQDAALAKGVNVAGGTIVNEPVAAAYATLRG